MFFFILIILFACKYNRSCMLMMDANNGNNNKWMNHWDDIYKHWALGQTEISRRRKKNIGMNWYKKAMVNGC